MAERIYTVEEHGPKIEAFLGKILKLGGLDVRLVVSAGESPHPEIEDPELVVRFQGRDVDRLLENKAELLLALEHLTMETLRMPSEHHERMCFDANDHRLMRIAELRLSATTAAERVKRTNTPFRFGPMTSRERRIIHLALRNEKEVRSESSGMGSYRQVVIYPAGMASQPDPPRAYGDRPRFGGGGGGGGRDRDRDRGGPGGRRDRGPRR
ncbi:MAG: single-stranded DNA-binding protein [Candidatus Solibacter usitatus]|nr:single-stranded DNA-binding protein [Candidatus Solibacter usitatus]